MVVTDLPEKQMDAIAEVVRRCENHASRLFSESSFFTSITKWNDGDFRVETRHGFSHEGTDDNRDNEYRQRYEIISYHHTQGEIIYAERTRYVDAKYSETHKRKVLE